MLSHLHLLTIQQPASTLPQSLFQAKNHSQIQQSLSHNELTKPERQEHIILGCKMRLATDHQSKSKPFPIFSILHLPLHFFHHPSLPVSPSLLTPGPPNLLSSRSPFSKSHFLKPSSQTSSQILPKTIHKTSPILPQYQRNITATQFSQ